MKKLTATVVLAIAALSICAFAQDDGADDEAFVKDVIKLAMTRTKPSTLQQASDMFDEATVNNIKAQIRIIAATVSKEEAEKLEGQLKELDSKIESGDKKEKKAAEKEKEALLDEMDEKTKASLEVKEGEQKELQADAAENLSKALTYLGFAIANDVVVNASMKDIIDRIKARGKSPAVMKDTKAAVSLSKSAPSQMKSLKEVAGSLIKFMKARNVEVPDAEKAMADAEKG